MDGIQLTFLDTDYARKLESVLCALDSKWSQCKSLLSKLQDIYDQRQQQSASSLRDIEVIFNDALLMSGDYHPNFEDMLIRIKNDLVSNEQLLFQLHELIDQHFRLLDSKVLFDTDDLSNIEKRLENHKEFLQEKDEELQFIEWELFSIPSDRNPYVRYGFKLNPFILTVPFEKSNIIVNQLEAQATAKDFINGVIRGSDSNILLIIGEQGIGKTHFLNYFAGLLNSGQFGRVLAVKIRSKPNKDMLDLYPQITEALKRMLNERNESELVNIISKILTESGAPRLVQDLMKILKKIEIQLGDKGYQNIFILVDAFENSLPQAAEHIPHLDYDFRQGRSTPLGTPQAISQLGFLTKLSGIGFILTFRKDDWNKWQEKVKQRVNKIKKKYTIAIEPLSLEDSKRFILHRLEAEEFKLPTDHPVAKPEFTQDTIESIWKKLNGNPRAMLRLASTLFGEAIRNDTKLIEPIELLETR